MSDVNRTVTQSQAINGAQETCTRARDTTRKQNHVK